ncbi:glycoside hydrolase family 43 protein [Algoriphagus sp. C2-6-M1]|uniref:glycoside hydrolase family 43 protein n=1 Tax=Algoriphagus persicinus TaxID=3108754 RepID=UPI002B3BEC21|nr:glycoside hydrolase family 43 protein [Algoriphagus sp. C2-6-M1]MEB2779015.1 glycoside hydrolase family 43 protein [Algoriphagus sp. C2-6-M1]
MNKLLGLPRIIIILLLFVGFSSLGFAQNRTFDNPVLAGDRPDPTVVKIGKYYYASATSNEWAPLFPIFKSTDLVNWDLVNYIFPEGAPSWAKNNFWAPELSYDEKQKKIYAYYTARDKDSNRLSVAVASADSPESNFTDHGPLVAQEYGSIDAFETRDENGKLYVLWKEDGNSKGQKTPIWAQEVNETRTALIGEKHELFRNDQPWEGGLVEGVAIFQKNGYFYATYSARGCCEITCDYVSGVARSKALLGPWEKYELNPVLKDNENWKCAGHGTVVEKDGDFWMLYHAYNTEGSVYVGRQGVLEKIQWTDDNWPIMANNAGYERSKASLEFTDNFRKRLDPIWQWRVTQDIQYETGKEGLKLQASEKNETLGTLLVQGTKSLDYQYEATIIPDGSAATGLAVIGGANNGFGAPPAGMGISVKGNQLILWETINQKTREIATQKIPDSKEVKLILRVKNGYKMTTSAIVAGTTIQVGEEQDVKHLVPWGMGFRLGMVAKGATDSYAHFKEVKISYL